MKLNSLSPRLLVLSGIIIFAAFIRLVPHPPNFAPIGAAALFSGAYLKNKKLAFVIPLFAMLITDAIIGLHSTMIAVYLSLALIVYLGIVMLKKKKVTNVFLAAVFASVIFFVVTNFAVWAVGTMYPKTAGGLIACYTAAIPFFHYTLLSNLFYAGIFFGLFELIKLRFPELQNAEV